MSALVDDQIAAIVGGSGDAQALAFSLAFMHVAAGGSPIDYQRRSPQWLPFEVVAIRSVCSSESLPEPWHGIRQSKVRQVEG